MANATDYVIPNAVQSILKQARQVLFYPPDESCEFPRIMVRFDGAHLPKDPEERLATTKELYDVLFRHITHDHPLGVFRCNFTSDNTTRSMRTFGGVQK